MSHSTLRPVIKLRSTAGTGYTYVTRKSRRNDPDRLVIRKYDPVACRTLSSGRSGNHEADNPPGLSSGRLPRPRGEFRLPHQVDRNQRAHHHLEDGRTYPVVDVEISSASHPFYTGQARVLDTAGRVGSSVAGMATTPRAPDDLR